MNPPGLYIHVPFCRSKCGYCDFYSETKVVLIPLYIESLLNEMTLYSSSFGVFDSIYIGGGTPSLLTPGDLGRIFEGLFRHLDFSPESEITMEANPADLTFDDLRCLRRLGINRLNIGVQSFCPAVLKFLGRRHSDRRAVEVIDDARKAGFDNIGLDLIYGEPGMDIGEWSGQLKTALAFEPEHLSCYELSLSPETPLGRKYAEGRFRLPDEKGSYRVFMKTAEILGSAGYIHYEVSNYAKTALFASRHNQKYWDHSPYLGLGPGAHSFHRRKRWWNHRSVIRYAGDLSQGEKPIEGSEILSADHLMLESLFLGLRIAVGIDLNDFREANHVDLENEKKGIIRKLQDDGFLLIRNGRLMPTLRGLAVADRLPLML